MMMSRATLPALAALALTGTAAGMYLGKAAVSEINPIHYQEPEPRFHGDLVPYRPVEVAGYQAGDLSAANLEQALGNACVGCRTYPEEVVLVHRAPAAKANLHYAEVASEPVPAAVYEQVPSPEFASIERYARYPVTTPPTEQAAEARAEVELAAAEPVETDPVQ
jgi:hypothetical protein